MNDKPQVGLFVTCLVNVFRPSVGFASVQLLEAAGCEVIIPEAQTCCGQPGYNPGDYDGARAVAKQVISQFSGFDYVVVPSGSCAGMIHQHYKKLLESDLQWKSQAEQLAEKTYELTQFLAEVMHYQPASTVDFSGHTFTYHDSCAGLRELNIKQQPRQLLKHCANIDIVEMKNTEECCGFGGTFCAKMPHISDAMVSDKLVDAETTGATTLVGGDMGCLLNIAGKASRLGKSLDVRHVAEILVADLTTPAIGKSETSYR